MGNNCVPLLECGSTRKYYVHVREMGKPTGSPYNIRHDQVPQSMGIYRYQWFHLPTGMSGFSSIACFSHSDFRFIVSYWDGCSDAWRFRPAMWRHE